MAHFTILMILSKVTSLYTQLCSSCTLDSVFSTFMCLNAQVSSHTNAVDDQTRTMQIAS